MSVMFHEILTESVEVVRFTNLFMADNPKRKYFYYTFIYTILVTFFRGD